MNKKMGKNFLVDKYILKKFIEIINPKENDFFIEIGAGYGNITDYIIKKIKKIVLVEYDNYIYKKLLLKYLNFKNKIIFLNKDARNLDIKNIISYNKKINFRIFGSIPYYASIKIINNLYKYIDIIKDVNFILQKELCYKLTSDINTSFYNKITILNKIFFDSEIKFLNILPESFCPKPKIKSSIINMIPNNNYKFIRNNNNIFLNFQKVLKISFLHKRKILNNNLKLLFNNKKIKIINSFINIKKIRPNNVTLLNYYKISKLL